MPKAKSQSKDRSESQSHSARTSFRPPRYNRRLWVFLAGVGVLTVVAAVRYFVDAGKAAAEGPLKVMAVVNGDEISRNDLARFCLWHYGEAVLDSLVNKHLIADHCKKKNIQVTEQEVNDEIKRVAQRFGLPVDQWLKMLKEERGIAPNQYGSDIIWPTLALRKLAANRVQPTPQELKEAQERYYGPAIKARLIVCNSMDKAQQVRQKAMANPDDFGNLSKDFSDDINVASAKGMIQPIRRHTGDEKVEQVAFSMQKGQVSDVITVAQQFIILKCEDVLPPRPLPKNYHAELEEAVREQKLREVAGGLFQQLQQESKTTIVFNKPEVAKNHPGVAAFVNERKISNLELAEECISRHGIEVLQGMISHRILEQACKQKNVTISREDEDQEIARAAAAMGKVDKQGRPDVDAWLKSVSEEQQVAVDIYIHDAVWPSVALKKLVGGSVKISEEDLQKGFEANYGPRVRCLAIVLNNQRQAHQVWEKARANNTKEFFGELARAHSVEANNAALGGEVRPIQKHGGQKNLEDEAFSLKEGELSSVIQVGDKFVILHCLGRTKPEPTTFAEVRQGLHDDLVEKKLRIAMADEYDRLMESAQIDNHLAGTTQSGKRAAGLKQSPQSPQLQKVPSDTSRAPPKPALGIKR